MRRLVAVGLLGYGALVGAYLLGRSLPARQALAALDARLDDRTAELAKAEVVASRREAFDRQATRLREEIGKLERILPSDAPIEPLRGKLPWLAGESGVRLGTIGGEELVERDFYREERVVVEVTASLGALSALAEALSGLLPLTRLSALEGSVSADGTFEGMAVVSTYRAAGS